LRQRQEVRDNLAGLDRIFTTSIIPRIRLSGKDRFVTGGKGANGVVRCYTGPVRRVLPREAAEGAAPADIGGTNAQAKGLTDASIEAFLAGERLASRGPTEGASGPPSNASHQSLR